MPTYQTASNFLVALKREATIATPPGAAGGTGLRIISSPGLKLARGQIRSAELRDDGVRAPGRLGGKSVAGSYNCEASAGGGNDILLEAMMRGTWATASALTTATGVGACIDLTAASSSTITRTGTGSFITDGWKVGDVARLGSYSTAADNDVNLFVKTVAAGTLTFFGTPLVVGAADTACTLTRLKKLVTPATPTRLAHYIEQYYEDMDLSRCFDWCRAVGMTISAKPKTPLALSFTLAGLDRTTLATGASPYYTTPTFTTGGIFVPDDGLWIKAGASVAALTGLEVTFALSHQTLDTIGSLTSPDVFDNVVSIDGKVTGATSDFADLTLFDAETTFDIGALFAVPGTAPVDTWAMYLPQNLFTDFDPGTLGGDGALVVSESFEVQPKAATLTSDATPAVFSSSAA